MYRTAHNVLQVLDSIQARCNTQRQNKTRHCITKRQFLKTRSVNNAVKKNNDDDDVTDDFSQLKLSTTIVHQCRWCWKTDGRVQMATVRWKTLQITVTKPTKPHRADGYSSPSYCAMSEIAETSTPTMHRTRTKSVRRPPDAASAETTFAVGILAVSAPATGVWSARPRVSQSLCTYSTHP